MGKRCVQSNILSFFASLFVLVWCLYILDHPTKFIFASLIAVLTFSLYRCLTSENDKILILIIRISRFLRLNYVYDMFFILFYIFSMILIILIPSITNSYYIKWYEIPFLNWLRLFAAILLSTFFPGYVIFRFVNMKYKFGTLKAFIFSYFLSIFLIPFSNFILLSVHLISQFGKQMVLLLNLLLLLLFTGDVWRKKVNTKYVNTNMLKIRIPIYKSSTLFCLFAFIIIGSYAVTLGNPYQAGDQWLWIGRSLQFLKGSFPVVNNRIIPFYPWWFDLYLTSFFIISGVPVLNAYGSLSFLAVLPSITFYLLLGQFFKQKRKVQLVGTVLTTFLGFGWTYYLYQKLMMNPSNLVDIFDVIRLAGNKTNDLWRGILLLPIEGIRPVYVIGYPALFTLIYLLARRWENRLVTWSDSFLITALVAVGYLGHMFEVLIFIGFYILIVLFGHNFPSQSKKISFAIFLGLLIVAIIDYLSPGKFYTVLKSSEGVIFSPYFFLFLFSVMLVSLLQFLRQKKFMFRSIQIQVNNSLIKFIAKIVFAIAIYIYGLSVLIWVSILNIYLVRGIIVPWYMYWIRLGVVGVLGLIGITYLVVKEDRKLKELSIFFLLALVFCVALILGRSPYFLHFDEGRLMFLLYIALIVPAAYIIVHYVSKLNRPSLKHKSILTFLLLVIIVSGMSSTLLKFEFFSLIGMRYGKGSDNPYAYVSSEEFDALNYLRTHLPSNATVATASDISRAKLEGLAGMSMMQARSSFGWGGDSAETWCVLFSSESPETVSYLLNSLKVKYIYLAQQDLAEIDQKYKEGYIAQHLLKYLPIAFNNSEVTIYEVPPLSTTSLSSNLALVLQEQTEISHVIDQEQTSYNKGLLLISSEIKLAQRFKPNHRRISRISIFAEKAGIPSTGITIEIQGDENGAPDGVTLAKGLIEEADVKTSRSEVIVNISYQSLNTSKYYHIVIYSNATNLDKTSVWYRIYLYTADVYSGGYFHKCSKRVSDWIRYHNYDLFFRIWIPVQKKIPLLQSSEADRRYIFPLEMIALSQHEYTVFSGDDNNRFSSSTLVLTYDPPLGTNLSEYLSWIKEGGRLIVLNSLGHDAFANFMDLHSNDIEKSNGIESADFSFAIPEIPVPQFSSGMKDIETIAYYIFNRHAVSSFAFRKDIESGELLYVEVLPYFSALINATDSLDRSLFANLSILIKTLSLTQTDPSLKGSLAISYPYVLTSGRINLTKNIQIKTSSLLFSDIKDLSLNSIDLSGSDYFKINRENSPESIYYNLTISDLEIRGPSYSIVNSSQASFGSSRDSLIHGTYVPIQLISDFNWILNLPNHTYITMNLLNESKSTFEVEIRGGSVELSLTPSIPIYAYLKNPLVSVQGEIKFGHAYVYILPYHPIVTGNVVEISGNTSFIIDRSDTSYVFISDFDSKGAINLVPTSVGVEIKIPWKEVLSSPIHLFFLINITFWLGWYVRRSIPKREKRKKRPT